MSSLPPLLLGATIATALTAPLIWLNGRRAERRARAAERRARRAERLAELGSMTSGLAHEIKNPLSTILLNAQLLREGIEDASLPEDESVRHLRRIDSLSRECERLRGILEDFLQFAGRMHLERESLDLGALLEEMTDFFHPQCAQASVRQRVQRPSHPVPASIDPRLFKQAILNLMINAVQAMEAADDAAALDGAGAGPARELMLRLDDSDPEVIRLHVIDTGPGIDPEKLEAIFHPYVSEKRGGTGLGLPTARRIVEEHGGTIAAFSDVGRGSDFVIELPREAAGSEATDADAESGAATPPR